MLLCVHHSMYYKVSREQQQLPVSQQLGPEPQARGYMPMLRESPTEHFHTVADIKLLHSHCGNVVLKYVDVLLQQLRDHSLNILACVAARQVMQYWH